MSTGIHHRTPPEKHGDSFAAALPAFLATVLALIVISILFG